MGRFEDLIEQAKSGDVEALETLETEFSGSTLRERAERADSLEAELQKLRPLQRQQRFNELHGKLDEGLREVLTIEDVGEMEPDSLTLESLQDLATTKAQARQAAKLEAAQEAGFDTVEDYESALQAVKQQTQQRREGMESVAAGVTASGGGEGSGTEPTRFDQSKKAYDEAKSEGATDDIAIAKFIETNLDAQAPVEA